MAGCEDREIFSTESNHTAKSCGDTFQNQEIISPAVDIATSSSPIEVAQINAEVRTSLSPIASAESVGNNRTGSHQRGMKRARNDVLDDDDNIAQTRIVRLRRNAMTPNGAHAEIARDVGILFQMETVCMEPSLPTASTSDCSSFDDADDEHPDSPQDFGGLE